MVISSMAFRNRFRHSSRNLEINLVPMMDVLMTVLTFFIIVSMTLTVERGVDIELPSAQPPVDALPDPDNLLIVEMDGQGQVQVRGQSLNEAQLQAQVNAFLAERPAGVVVLRSHPDTPYEQVMHHLDQLKQLGGDRVSLAID